MHLFRDNFQCHQPGGAVPLACLEGGQRLELWQQHEVRARGEARIHTRLAGPANSWLIRPSLTHSPRAPRTEHQDDALKVRGRGAADCRLRPANGRRHVAVRGALLPAHHAPVQAAQRARWEQRIARALVQKPWSGPSRSSISQCRTRQSGGSLEPRDAGPLSDQGLKLNPSHTERLATHPMQGGASKPAVPSKSFRAIWSLITHTAHAWVCSMQDFKEISS